MIGNFVIFGDSYSTYKDRIPEGYPTFYTPDEVPPTEKVRNMTAEETWWGRLVQETDARLVRNDSWSGSTLGYTGYAGDCSQLLKSQKEKTGSLFTILILAKTLQSCPTLCDPINGSPPGSAVPGILQARTLEWVAMSSSST